MSFDWTNYLVFSKYILNDAVFKDKETIHRNVISRSYYAAHHHMRDLMPYLPTWSSDSRDDSIHVRVIKEFKNKVTGDKNLGLLCDDYKKLFDWRKYSDYDNNLSESGIKSQKSIIIAEEVIELKSL